MVGPAGNSDERKRHGWRRRCIYCRVSRRPFAWVGIVGIERERQRGCELRLSLPGRNASIAGCLTAEVRKTNNAVQGGSPIERRGDRLREAVTTDLKLKLAG